MARKELILTVAHKGIVGTWDESGYFTDELKHPDHFNRRRSEILTDKPLETLEECYEWAEKLIEWFNSTCVGEEKHRELIRIRFTEEE